mgnify:CR=1 FL=1
MKKFSSVIQKRLLWGIVSLCFVMVIGTAGYYYISNGTYSLLDCFYMTFITVASIGFDEIIDLSHNPAGRVFTIIIAFSGIGVATYSISLFTALIVEGDLKETFARKKMDKTIKKMNGHFIVCGIGRVGLQIINELRATNRTHVIVDVDEKKLAALAEISPDQLYIQGDATDEETLINAGVERAIGIFAATEDDSRNLVISLTAKHLNTQIRVVVRCNHPSHIEKMKKAGADVVTLPAHMGASRMVAEMVRPHTMSFFDSLLRDEENNVRAAEIIVADRLAGKQIATLKLHKYPTTILIAVKTHDEILYKPSDDYVLKEHDILFVFSTAAERKKLENTVE